MEIGRNSASNLHKQLASWLRDTLPLEYLSKSTAFHVLSAEDLPQFRIQSPARSWATSQLELSSTGLLCNTWSVFHNGLVYIKPIDLNSNYYLQDASTKSKE